MKNQNVILSMTGVSKSFPGVKALKKIDLEIERGSIHGLIGENGAGKSTLMKILSGVYKKDEGTVFFKGKEVKDITPKESQELGISIIYQEFNLISALSIAENIFLNRLGEKDKEKSVKIIKWKEINKRASILMNSIGCDLNVKELVEEVSVAQKQMVEIAKALSYNSELIIMDEPSAVLTSNELNTFFKVIQDLKNRGVTIIYISHKLDEIFELCDKVTVLRDGEVIDTKKISDISKEEIIQKMVGRTLDNEFPKRVSNIGEEILSVKNLYIKNKIKNISFNLLKGEILGIVGLVGAGRTETVRAIFGADKKQAGEVYINGNKIEINSPVKSIRSKMVLLTEDRKQQGLFLKYNVKQNISIMNLNRILHGVFISKKKETAISKKYIDDIGIKTPSENQITMYLSGGNQQKVVVAKSLFADPEILIMDEPTRGIDVGAKYDIYVLMNNLVSKGKSIIFISSELPEVLAMSDRILVFYKGMINGEFDRKDLGDAKKILKCAIGE